MIYRGFNKEFSGLVIFFISALAHEYIISVALMRPSYWAFLAMLMQFFVIFIEKQMNKIFKLRDTWVGNFSFWASFCILGQPVLIICYYIDYISTTEFDALAYIRRLIA